MCSSYVRSIGGSVPSVSWQFHEDVDSALEGVGQLFPLVSILTVSIGAEVWLHTNQRATATARVSEGQRPETPDDPGLITDDESKLPINTDGVSFGYMLNILYINTLQWQTGTLGHGMHTTGLTQHINCNNNKKKITPQLQSADLC